jgi:hypothetical protein
MRFSRIHVRARLNQRHQRFSEWLQSLAAPWRVRPVLARFLLLRLSATAAINEPARRHPTGNKSASDTVHENDDIFYGRALQNHDRRMRNESMNKFAKSKKCAINDRLCWRFPTHPQQTAHNVERRVHTAVPLRHRGGAGAIREKRPDWRNNESQLPWRQQQHLSDN